MLFNDNIQINQLNHFLLTNSIKSNQKMKFFSNQIDLTQPWLGLFASYFDQTIAPLTNFLFISNKVYIVWTKVFILSYLASKGHLICKRDA